MDVVRLIATLQVWGYTDLGIVRVHVRCEYTALLSNNEPRRPLVLFYVMGILQIKRLAR